MKRVAIVLGIVVVAVAGYWGYSAYRANKVEPTPEPSAAMDSGPEMIWASGTLLPARWAALSFQVGGVLDTLSVEEGELVAKGELLVSVDAPDLEYAVDQAQAALDLAQAQLARVRAGARSGDVAVAEVQLSAAEAGLDAAQAGVSSSQANLQAARAAMSDVEPAKAAVSAAEAERARLRSGPRAEAIAVAEAQLQQAATELAFAQNQFDRFSWVGGGTSEQVRYQRDAAAAAHQTAQAQLNLTRAQATAEELAIAEAAVAAAQARLDQAETAKRASEAQISGAEAAVEAARAQVANADAGVTQAEAHLQLLRSGATPEEIAVSEAYVAQARAALAQAEGTLDKLQLRAPFDGTVGQVRVRQGELVSPGQEVIVLGDLTHLRVETTDLRETDVARVVQGQVVEVTFDALPGQVWQGTIARLAPMSRQEQGSTNYTAIVELDDVDPRLRWGMTAFVNIPAKE